MGHTGSLPGTETVEQIVCHVDMDCFYAACERLREPPLRGEPVVVGMGYEPDTASGAVATASYEAREYGVESAQPISEALQRLPRKIDATDSDEHAVEDAGYYRPVDMEYYESVAAKIRRVLRANASVLREISIDEAYLDLTDRLDWTQAGSFATELKDQVAREVGVTASVGVAPTMSAAKVASDQDKPDGLVVVEPGEVASFFAPLPVKAVHGVGPVTAQTLQEMDIETAGDLAAADPSQLENKFGKRGRRIWRFARGEDTRTVEPKDKPKSFSRESAFQEPTADTARQHSRLQSLATAVTDRADRRNVLYQTIGIKVVVAPYDVRTRTESVPGPIGDPSLVESLVADLFEEFEGQPVRKLGVRLSNLCFHESEQPTLAEWTTDENDPERSDTTSTEPTSNETQRRLSDYTD